MYSFVSLRLGDASFYIGRSCEHRLDRHSLYTNRRWKLHYIFRQYQCWDINAIHCLGSMHSQQRNRTRNLALGT